MTALPPRFAERMRRLLGPESASFESALAEPPTPGLRVNTLKLEPAEFRRLSDWPLTPVPWCPSGFTLTPDDWERLRPGAHPFHHAGLYYLQDPSAMAVAEALAPRSGELVADLAAAPGGKSTHLAALLAGTGALLANDVHSGRVRALGQNLERWGVSRCLVSHEEIGRLADRLGAGFDAVLLDAPCSGEGMFRKSPEALRDWSDATVERCALRQRELLDEAARLVRPGGRLAYSTCTFAPEENEGAVTAFLRRHPDFRLEPLTLAGSSPGRADWSDGDAPVERCARFWPHRGVGEGHFVALLSRGGTGATAPPRRQAAAAASVRHKALWLHFASLALTDPDLGGLPLVSVADRLYARPDELPHLSGLRVLRAGLWLGTVRKDRFEPAHSLALALPAQRFRHRLDLAPDDPRTAAYLHGHPLEAAGPDGWLAVTVAGFALGWGKRSRGVINNAYPKGLRIR